MNELTRIQETTKDLDLAFEDLMAGDPEDGLSAAPFPCGCFGCREGCGGCREGCRGCRGCGGCREGCGGCRH